MARSPRPGKLVLIAGVLVALLPGLFLALHPANVVKSRGHELRMSDARTLFFWMVAFFAGLALLNWFNERWPAGRRRSRRAP